MRAREPQEQRSRIPARQPVVTEWGLRVTGPLGWPVVYEWGLSQGSEASDQGLSGSAQRAEHKAGLRGCR